MSKLLFAKFGDISFKDIVRNRLLSLGLDGFESDDLWLFGFCVQKVEEGILNFTHTDEVPEGLMHTACDMVCGEYLKTKYETGMLEIASLDLTGALSSVTEGDTSVSFDGSTSDETKFQTLLDYLLGAKARGDLICYRKIKW